MTDNDTTADKAIVEELNFGAKTAKRVGWEAWEFSVSGPHQIEVTNASWGQEKDDHSYIVGIEERDGRILPAECECKADRFRDDYDCKHKLALATVGGSVVLQAAIEVETSTVNTEENTKQTLKEKLCADGGATTEDASTLDVDDNDECDCEVLPGNFPCAECYISGKRELPE